MSENQEKPGSMTDVTKRPKITDEMVLKAAKEISEKLDGDAATIAEYYRHHMDGYELAKELDRYAGWDLNMMDVEELDGMSSIVDQLLRDAEKIWFKENNIQPPLPIGTMTTDGLITGVCSHSPARYLVKQPGCTNKNERLLVKYEEAVAA